MSDGGTVLEGGLPVEGSAGGVTHLEGGDTQLEGGLTHVEAVGDATVVEVLEHLRERFELVGGIPGGVEADVVIVRPHGGGATRVVKVYRLRLAPPPEEVRERIGRAEHAHVVRVDPPETWRGVTYELMEHCELGSLRDLIDQEGPRLDEHLVREILIELHAAVSIFIRSGWCTAI